MTTSTIQRSEDLNVAENITQTSKFEEALHSALERMGEKFGLYDIMVKDGPLTAPCLATQAGISLQVAQVWLDAQASRNYFEHYRTTNLYSLCCSWPRPLS